MSLDKAYEFDDKKEECGEDGSDTGGVAHGPGQEVDYSQTAKLPLEDDNPPLPDPILHYCPAQEEEADDYSFEVLSLFQIFQHIAECIQVVKEIIDHPATTTRILLSHFSWDKDKLIERYFDGNLDTLFSECHVVNPSEESLTCPLIVAISPVQDMPCEICYLDHPNTTFTGLGCAHKFCMQCWRDYLTTRITAEGMGPTISCPAYSCDILVDDNTILSLITDSEVKLKYQRLIANSFVERNRLFKWCPTPDCHHVIRVEYPAAKPVRCKCGRQFCFSCGENWHIPVKCKWLKKWMKKCTEEGATYSWIAGNTKNCPECHIPIEKNGGCNYMLCQNQICRSEFCWHCMGPWAPKHLSNFVCSPTTYDEDAAKAARDAQEHSRADLQRYLLYYNSYMNDMHSLRFEHELYANVQKKMEEVTGLIPLTDLRFLKWAADVLCQCRSTLTFTCAFAFYLKKNNEAIMFENNLADLMSAVEVLSRYLAHDITRDSLQDIKQKVTLVYRYCESRRRVLLQHVHEGYEKDLWEYRED